MEEVADLGQAEEIALEEDRSTAWRAGAVTEASGDYA